MLLHKLFHHIMRLYCKYLYTYLLIAFLGNFLLIPYILETSQVRKRRISDVCSLHWTCNVPNVHAVDPGIRHILHSQPERLTKRCKSFLRNPGIFIFICCVFTKDFFQFYYCRSPSLFLENRCSSIFV